MKKYFVMAGFTLVVVGLSSCDKIDEEANDFIEVGNSDMPTAEYDELSRDSVAVVAPLSVGQCGEFPLDVPLGRVSKAL